MIEKKRLQEIIEKGETICNKYMDWDNNWHYRFGKVIQDKDGLIFKENGSSKTIIMCDINYLYETQEQAEWVAQMHTERIERFAPPLWKDFDRSFWFNTAKGYSIGILRLVNDTAEPNFNRECIYIWNCLDGHKNMGLSNKKNYIKACEYAKALFLGKETANETNSNK